MGRMQGMLRDCSQTRFQCLLVGALLGVLIPSMAAAQVRGKLPDRGVYQPPRLGTPRLGTPRLGTPQLGTPQLGTQSSLSGQPLDPSADSDGTADLLRTEESQQLDVHQASTPRQSESTAMPGKKSRPLVEVVLDVPDATPRPEVGRAALRSATRDATSGSAAPLVRQVAHEDIVLVPPKPPADLVTEGDLHPIGKLIGFPHDQLEGPVVHPGPVMHHDATCDGCDACDASGCDPVGCGIFGCDSCDASCDTLGCDSMGIGCQPWYRRWANKSLCFDRDRWFGSVEYLMMWRRGDRLPPLVTTDVSGDPDPDTAGEIGNPDTRVLVGQDRIMQRLSSGGRLTIGTWLDDRQCLGLVARGWLAGRKNYRYDQNQDQTSILIRPFFNVSDGQDATQDTQIIAFPDRASGAVHVAAKSEAFGADLSIRQFLYGDLGATLDFLYGYQFMRFNESLGIASTSTSLDEDFAPLGAVLAIADSFRVSNEFHGGQIGLATNYRECCWSFNALAKVGFGSLRRRAKRAGITVTTVDDETAVENTGLLVRSTNDGTVTDHTFGWVPELDVTLGWHRFANCDLTFGYHIIAMTDAWQPSGAIDPDLAVNLSDPPTGQQRPTAGVRDRTFYLQGIHFGLQHVY